MRREHSFGERLLRKSVVSELVCGIFSRTFDLVEGVIENFIQEQRKRILKQASVAIVFITGTVFLLNSLALFISDYLVKSPWVGYGVVGGALVLLAVLFRKE